MSEDRKKIAVIGTGAAGFGVLTALLDKQADFEIVIYDIGREVDRADLPENAAADEISRYYDTVYGKINSDQARKFPPPKTHMAKQIPRQPVGGGISIFKSDSFGGLTNYWGSTMLPFTDRELADWPITKEDLAPYYERISGVVGMSAAPDALNEYFGNDFATRPPLKPTAELSALDDAINSNNKVDNFKIISGRNRCGVETREDSVKKCVYCGECLAGCFKDAIFSARHKISEYLSDPRVSVKNSAVKAVKKADGLWEIETTDGRHDGGYDQVFLAAGCPSSTEIALRSFAIKDSVDMADNAVYVFPIFYFGRRRTKDDAHASLCNLIIGCVPKDDKDNFAQAQIYPNFDYMWRYNIPNFFWPLIRPLIKWSRARVFWGRLYLHSDHSQSYSVRLENDELLMAKNKKAGYGRLKTLMSDLRKAVNRKGFFLPPHLLLLQKVNSHYTSTLPFGNKVLPVSSGGEIAPGLYLCDSSTFPAAPAMNPGFTIMANACRIADQAVN